MKQRSKKPVNARFREVVDRKPSLLRASKWFLFSFSSLLPCGGSKAKDNGKTRGFCTLGSSILSRNEEILIKLLAHDSSHCSEKYSRRCSFFNTFWRKKGGNQRVTIRYWTFRRTEELKQRMTQVSRMRIFVRRENVYLLIFMLHRLSLDWFS